MKFSCDKSVFQEAVINASGCVAQKSTIPALEGLLISADENISVCGYDLKTAINCSCSAEISEKGSIVINSKILCDIIRKMPNDTISFSCNENNVVNIKCGFSEFDIIGINGEEFPKLPETENENSFSISQKLLKEMISQSIFAVSDNDAKPVHTGSKFEIGGGKLKIVSVDGFRLAIRTEQLDLTSAADEYSFVVPGNALREMQHILNDIDEPVNAFIDKKFIMFKIGGVTLITRLLEGEFLNYQKAIPADMDMKYKVNVKNFIDSIERVSLIVNEKLKTPVKFVFKQKSVFMTCVTSLGKAQDECAVEGCDGEIEIGFNYKFMLDALKACQDDEIIIDLKSSLCPCIMHPVNGESFLYMVLPVRLKNE